MYLSKKLHRMDTFSQNALRMFTEIRISGIQWTLSSIMAAEWHARFSDHSVKFLIFRFFFKSLHQFSPFHLVFVLYDEGGRHKSETLFMYIKIYFLSIEKCFQLTYKSQQVHNGIRTYVSDQNYRWRLLAVQLTLGLGGQFNLHTS